MRPRIICHMISSVDGRLLPSRWTPLVDETRDNAQVISERYEQAADRFHAEGFIIGRKTTEEFDGVTAASPSLRGDVSAHRPVHAARRAGQSVAVVFDPSGKLHYQTDTLDDDYHVITVLSEKVADDYLAELRGAGVSYVFAGPEGDDVAAAMQSLSANFALKVLLLEGGGIVNGTFLKASLIDEISLLVYPGIDGLAGTPSIFDYHGEEGSRPAAGQSLRYAGSEVLDGGFVWIRYGVERA